MKKMSSNIFSFIIGVVISGSISIVSAYALFATDIEYTPNDKSWKVDNVKDAIDDLYSRSLSNVQTDYLWSGEENLEELFDYSVADSNQYNSYRKDGTSIAMSVATYNNIMSAYTKDLVDFTGYKYILVEYSIRNNYDSLRNTSYFGITDSKSASISDFIKSSSVIQIGQSSRNGIACIDISDIQGKHYFKISVHHGTENNAYNSFTNIYSIKMIK